MAIKTVVMSVTYNDESTPAEKMESEIGSFFEGLSILGLGVDYKTNLIENRDANPYEFSAFINRKF